MQRAVLLTFCLPQTLWLLQGRPGGAHRPLEHEAQAEEAEKTDPRGIPEPVLDGGIGSVFN